jgi:uncharacterized protein
MTSQSEVASGSGPGGPPGGEPFDPVGVRWNRVSTKLAAARRLTGLLALAVVTVVLLVLAVLLGSWWWVSPVVPVAVGGWWWWLAGRQVAAIGYAERVDDLLVRRGILWRYIVVVPYGRLQYVDVQAGPVDRVFGIARVQLHTASAATDAMIPGLPPAEAARVRDRLAARGQARLAGL